MIYRLSIEQSDFFLKRPESGMGYQLVQAVRGGYYGSYHEQFVIYNSSLIVDYDDNFITNRRNIASFGFSEMLRRASVLSLHSTIFVSKRNFDQRNFSRVTPPINKGRRYGGTGAIDNPSRNADGEEIFVRLSAFENDRRVDTINRKFLPGTYATTLIDYLTCLRYEDDPIDRYALPSNDPIKWTFYVQPKRQDKLQEGIVQPLFDHNGGGLEVYFEDGTSENTYFQKKTYGDVKTT